MDKLCNMDTAKHLRINIGGTSFICHSHILKRFPESFLADLENQMPNSSNGEYFFDRNPHIFSYILDGFRKGSIHLPRDICGTTFKDELVYWEISKDHVAPCCWEALYRSGENMLIAQKLIDNCKENAGFLLLQKNDKSIRNQLRLFLDEPTSSRYAMVNISKYAALLNINVYILFKSHY